MLTPQKLTYVPRILLAAALLLLAGCGSGSPSASSGNFAGTVAPSIAAAEVTGVSLASSHVIGGGSTQATITLAQPAPDGGVEVQLTSSDANTVTIPASVRIPAGQTSAVATFSTAAVSAVTKVGIGVAYGDSVAGTSLTVAPAAAPASTFTVAVTPIRGRHCRRTPWVHPSYDYSSIRVQACADPDCFKSAGGSFRDV